MITCLGLGILRYVALWRWLMSAQPGQTSRPWAPQRYRQEAQRPDAKLPESAGVFLLRETVPRRDWCRVDAP
jgi:hypothetical protein